MGGECRGNGLDNGAKYGVRGGGVEGGLGVSTIKINRVWDECEVKGLGCGIVYCILLYTQVTR